MENIKTLFVMIKQVLYVLSNKQKRNSIWVFSTMVIGSFLELLGVTAIYPFLQTIVAPEQLAGTWYVSLIYKYIGILSIKSLLLIFGFLIILLYLVKNAFLLYASYVQNNFAKSVYRELSTKMLASYMKRPYQFFLNTNSAEIRRGTDGDIHGVYDIILNFFSIFSELLTISLLGIYLLITDISMAIGALILALVCLMLVVLGLKGKMKKAGIAAREADKVANQRAYQTILGIKEIMVIGRQKYFLDSYDEAVEEGQKANLIFNFIQACPDRIIEGICISGFIGIVCVRIMLDVNLSEFIPVLGSFVMAAFKILPSVSKVSNRTNSLVYYQQHLAEAYENLHIVDEYEENYKKYVIANNIRDDNKKDFLDNIKIENVSWKYDNSNKNVLSNVSFEIKRGEAIALIGPSGAGKTTLADMILGLLKPQEGKIMVDGTDIYSIPKSWCNIIGYVPQGVYLLDDTIRNNIAFGLPEKEIDDELILNALEKAQLKEFVMNLPQKLDTMVGERGVKFSGGQRQRVAIARALYHTPQILILDEATSALDNETEKAVMDSIDALHGRLTLLIVAHRLSTIKKCDTIYEIKDCSIQVMEKEQIFEVNK